MIFVLYFAILMPVSCCAWWQPALDPHDPAANYRTLLCQQVDDPRNPTISYNLGIAALQQKKYDAADNHFALATELYERDDARLVPAYFSWADGAAHQLLELMQKHPNLKDKPLDEAIDRAGRASERYGNVLVLDEEHEDAELRKSMVDKIKKLLEQKKRQEQEQKQQEEQQKEQDKNQKSEGGDSDAKENDQGQEQKDQSQQQQGDEAQDGKGSPQSGQDASGPEGGDKELQRGQDQQQQDAGGHDKDVGKEVDPGSDSGMTPSGEQGSEQKEESTSGSQKGEQKDDVAEQQDGGADEQSASSQGTQDGEDDKGTSEESHGAEQEHNATAGMQDGQEDQTGGQQAGMAVAQTSEQLADDMARRRAVVLLDKLEQDESKLQKQLLRDKAQSQQSGYAYYNQW